MDPIQADRRALLLAPLLAAAPIAPASASPLNPAQTNLRMPAIIAICAIGPVNYALTDPSKSGWRAI